MMKKAGAVRTLARATMATVRMAGVTLLATALYGMAMTICDKVVYGALDMSDLSGASNQTETVRVILSLFGLQLGVEVFLGPIIAALAIYVGRHTVGNDQSPSVYGGINFAMNRYRNLLIPHAVAWLSIWMGMIIIVPGILFLLQYAFVDAVACTEKEGGPLSRSKRLTRGRRRTLFFIMLPWLVISQAASLFQLWAMSQTVWLMLFGNMLLGLVVFVTFIAFYLVYDERTRPKGAAVKSG